MKPLFTFLIPCYNGVQYINDCIHSLVNDRIDEEKINHLYEIIFIDDGSNDGSYDHACKIAEKLNQKIRTNFMRVYTKPNGQYGSVINKGLTLAKGHYFKVLDVDDTFNTSSFIKLILIAKGLNQPVDMILTDHTFEKIGTNNKELMSLRNAFEPNILIDPLMVKWPKALLTMHSIIYRTELLKKMNFKQIEGVYYSDSQFSLIPLLKIKTMYYIHLPLYRYYIGRDEQSINMGVMIRNKQHQFIVREQIWKTIDFKKIQNSELKSYIKRSMKDMVSWSLLLTYVDPNCKNKAQEIMRILNDCKAFQTKEHREILSGPLFTIVKMTRGKHLSNVVKMAVKIYAKYKKNIMAEWD